MVRNRPHAGVSAEAVHPARLGFVPSDPDVIAGPPLPPAAIGELLRVRD